MDSKSANNDNVNSPQEFHEANKQRTKLPLKQAKSESYRLRREQEFRQLLLELDEPLPCPSKSDKSSPRYRTRNRKNVDPNYQMRRAEEFKQLLLEIEQPLSSPYESDKSQQQKIQHGQKNLISSPFATKYVLLREAIMYSENKKKYDDSRKYNTPSEYYVQSAPDNVVSSPAITKSVKENLHLREATSCSTQANGTDKNSNYRKDKMPRQCTRSDYKNVLSNPERTKPVLLREATWTVMKMKSKDQTTDSKEHVPEQRKNRKKNVDPNYHMHRAEESRQLISEIEQPLLSSYKSDKSPQQDMVSNPAIAKTRKEHLLVRKATSCIEQQTESKKNHVDAYSQKRLEKSKNVDLDYQMRRAEEFQELLREIEQPLPLSTKGDQYPRYHLARTKRKSVDPNYQKSRLKELRGIVLEIENQLPSSTERDKSPQCLTKEEQDIEFENIISEDEKLFGLENLFIEENMYENQLLAFGNPSAEADRDQNQLLKFENPSAEEDSHQNQLLEFENPSAKPDKGQNQLLEFWSSSAEEDRDQNQQFELGNLSAVKNMNENQLLAFGNPSAEADRDQNQLLEFGNPSGKEDWDIVSAFINPDSQPGRKWIYNPDELKMFELSVPLIDKKLTKEEQDIEFENIILEDEKLFGLENLFIEENMYENQLLAFGNPFAKADRDQNQLLEFGNPSAEEDSQQNQLLEFENPSSKEDWDIVSAFINPDSQPGRKWIYNPDELKMFKLSLPLMDKKLTKEQDIEFEKLILKDEELFGFWIQSTEEKMKEDQLLAFGNPSAEADRDQNQPLLDKKLTKEEQNIEFEKLILKDEELFGFWIQSREENINENQVLAFGNPSAEADKAQNLLLDFGNPSAEQDRDQNQLLEFGNPADENMNKNQLLALRNPSAEADKAQNELLEFGNLCPEKNINGNQLLEKNRDQNQLLGFGNPFTKENRNENASPEENMNQNKLPGFWNLSSEESRNQNQLLRFWNQSSEANKNDNRLPGFWNPSPEENTN